MEYLFVLYLAVEGVSRSAADVDRCECSRSNRVCMPLHRASTVRSSCAKSCRISSSLSMSSNMRLNVELRRLAFNDCSSIKKNVWKMSASWALNLFLTNVMNSARTLRSLLMNTLKSEITWMTLGTSAIFTMMSNIKRWRRVELLASLEFTSVLRVAMLIIIPTRISIALGYLSLNFWINPKIYQDLIELEKKIYLLIKELNIKITFKYLYCIEFV